MREVGEEDPVERFLGMIDWGNVPRPTAWDEEDEDEVEERFADALEIKYVEGARES